MQSLNHVGYPSVRTEKPVLTDGKPQNVTFGAPNMALTVSQIKAFILLVHCFQKYLIYIDSVVIVVYPVSITCYNAC